MITQIFTPNNAKEKGFTLAEVITVVIIVGVLASLAIPRFTGTFERVRASEGVQILTALLGAQKAFEFENGVFSTDPALLDVTITRADNFDVPPTVDDVDPIASITRTGGYTLHISQNGVISCTDGAILCAQAGY